MKNLLKISESYKIFKNQSLKLDIPHTSARFQEYKGFVGLTEQFQQGLMVLIEVENEPVSRGIQTKSR
jgi:hypothetical protein